MATKNLFKINSPDRTEAFKVEDVDGTASIYVDGTKIAASAAELNILDGVTATAAEINYNDLTTLGTGEASKVVALDANEDFTTSGNAGTITIASGDTLDVIDGLEINSVAVTATAAELNRVADTSTRLVAVGGTSLAVTQALHDGKVILLDHTGAESTVTLPAATGSGSVYRFVVAAVNTSNHVIVTSAASVLFTGSVHSAEAGGTVVPFAAGASDDTITLNGTTSGGTDVGDYVEIIDIATDTYAVRGHLTTSGCEVTPFSSSD